MMKANLTVIIPAYNESASIVDTVKSIQRQSLPPKRIIVVDDGSTDNTGDLARSCGVHVIRPPHNTGTKAGAQNFALQSVETTLTMAVDADTTLAPDAIEKLIEAFYGSKHIVAACGFVIPRFVKTLWERGRYIEYLLAFTFYKPIQDHIGKPLISSGCFSMYRTAMLKAENGWPTRTMAEDMDLTWSFYVKGYGVRFIPTAVCYPIEPHDYQFMSKQLKRWSHGFVQNVQLHWRDVMQIQPLNTIIAVAMWDAFTGTILYVIIIPFLVIYLHNLYFLLGYIIDSPVTFVPVLYKGLRRGEGLKALLSFPSFIVLRTVNSFFMLEAFWSELITRKRLITYEKGH